MNVEKMRENQKNKSLESDNAIKKDKSHINYFPLLYIVLRSNKSHVIVAKLVITILSKFAQKRPYISNKIDTQKTS